MDLCKEQNLGGLSRAPQNLSRWEAGGKVTQKAGWRSEVPWGFLICRRCPG